MAFNYVKWAHKKQSKICARATITKEKHQLLQFSGEMSICELKGALRSSGEKEFYKQRNFRLSPISLIT